MENQRKNFEATNWLPHTPERSNDSFYEIGKESEIPPIKCEETKAFNEIYLIIPKSELAAHPCQLYDGATVVVETPKWTDEIYVERLIGGRGKAVLCFFNRT